LNRKTSGRGESLPTIKGSNYIHYPHEMNRNQMNNNNNGNPTPSRSGNGNVNSTPRSVNSKTPNSFEMSGGNENNSEVLPSIFNEDLINMLANEVLRRVPNLGQSFEYKIEASPDLNNQLRKRSNLNRGSKVDEHSIVRPSKRQRTSYKKYPNVDISQYSSSDTKKIIEMVHTSPPQGKKSKKRKRNHEKERKDKKKSKKEEYPKVTRRVSAFEPTYGPITKKRKIDYESVKDENISSRTKEIVSEKTKEVVSEKNQKN